MMIKFNHTLPANTSLILLGMFVCPIFDKSSIKLKQLMYLEQMESNYAEPVRLY